jgi:hypothetical protein
MECISLFPDDRDGDRGTSESPRGEDPFSRLSGEGSKSPDDRTELVRQLIADLEALAHHLEGAIAAYEGYYSDAEYAALKRAREAAVHGTELARRLMKPES